MVERHSPDYNAEPAIDDWKLVLEKFPASAFHSPYMSETRAGIMVCIGYQLKMNGNLEGAIHSFTSVIEEADAMDRRRSVLKLAVTCPSALVTRQRDASDAPLPLFPMLTDLARERALIGRVACFGALSNGPVAEHHEDILADRTRLVELFPTDAASFTLRARHLKYVKKFQMATTDYNEARRLMKADRNRWKDLCDLDRKTAKEEKREWIAPDPVFENSRQAEWARIIDFVPNNQPPPRNRLHHSRGTHRSPSRDSKSDHSRARRSPSRNRTSDQSRGGRRSPSRDRRSDHSRAGRRSPSRDRTSDAQHHRDRTEPKGRNDHQCDKRDMPQQNRRRKPDDSPDPRRGNDDDGGRARHRDNDHGEHRDPINSVHGEADTRWEPEEKRGGGGGDRNRDRDYDVRGGGGRDVQRNSDRSRSPHNGTYRRSSRHSPRHSDDDDVPQVEWGVKQTASWMRGLGKAYVPYAQIFADDRVDGHILAWIAAHKNPAKCLEERGFRVELHTQVVLRLLAKMNPSPRR